LSRRNITTTRPSTKLDYKRLGPFKILEVVGESKMAFTLDLPPGMKIHPVFHASLLDPHHANTIPGRTRPPPPAITVEDALEYKVKEILDSRVRTTSSSISSTGLVTPLTSGHGNWLVISITLSKRLSDTTGVILVDLPPRIFVPLVVGSQELGRKRGPTVMNTWRSARIMRGVLGGCHSNRFLDQIAVTIRLSLASNKILPQTPTLARYAFGLTLLPDNEA
jgi:hypothetical protein